MISDSFECSLCSWGQTKKVCISCEQKLHHAKNNVDSILIEGIDKVAIDDVSTCANCGKEGSDVNNECNKCKMVKYCNAACKKKHRSKHKKACERRAVEVYDEALFKDVEPEECPLCFLMLPYESKTSSFMSCCGKVICNGCIQ